MPRRNIFATEKLELDYENKSFILKKNDNQAGRRYDPRAAYNLLKTIQNEIIQSNHPMNYNLKEFNITPRAQEKIEEYKKQKLESKV